jgi:hypothetical protein
VIIVASYGLRSRRIGIQVLVQYFCLLHSAHSVSGAHTLSNMVFLYLRKGSRSLKLNIERYLSCLTQLEVYNLNQTILRGRSPQANYTDRATAVCRQS